MLDAANITIDIDRKRIVENVSLSVGVGELVAVIGPNGSGKTTLVKAIAGDLPYTGTVRLGDTDLRRMKPWQAATRRAVMPQASTLSFPFTVREVVALGLTAGRSGLSPEQVDTLPERALERVDLPDFAGRFYGELSGGEQQRVQLARVLCQVWQPVLEGMPRLLILDEPVASLDIRHQLLVMRIARDFARAGGAVLAILHDLNLAGMFADRILAMKAGRAAAFGSPETVLESALMEQVFDCPLEFTHSRGRIVMQLPADNAAGLP